MSHNKIKINTKTQDANGDINLDLNDLSDVTISNPLTDQVLEYNGSSFINESYGDFESDIKFSFINPTSGWSPGSYTYIVNDYFTVRKYQAVVNSDTGFTFNNAGNTNSPLSNTRWGESIDIPTAGKYLFIMMLASRGTGYSEWRMSNNAGLFGPKCRLHDDNINGSIAIGISDCVANDIFRLVLLYEESSMQLADDPQQRCMSIQIYKIG